MINNSAADCSISLTFGRVSARDIRSKTDVQGHGVKDQGHSVTYWGKICKIINNSAGDCSISIKFITVYDHITLDLPQTVQVNGSKVKV